MKKINLEKVSSLSYLKYTLAVFLGLFIASYCILFLVDKKIRTGNFEEIKTSERLQINTQSDIIGDSFRQVISDIRYLSQTSEVQIEEGNYNFVKNNMKAFSDNKGIYDQIRYLDSSGHELVRINATGEGGIIVSDDKLQNKSSRYYFTESLGLHEGEVYISPLDLNIENGSIETPFKPVIRFSTPLLNDEHDSNGVIIMNYLAKDMIDRFKSLSYYNHGTVSLLNSRGYYLSSKDPNLEWGFMFEDKKNLSMAVKYVDEWERIKHGETQFLTTNGLFTAVLIPLESKLFNHTNDAINPDLVLGDGSYYIVSLIERNKTNATVFPDNTTNILISSFYRNSIFFFFVLLVSIGISILIYLNRKTYKKIKYYSEFDSLTKVYNRRAGLSKINIMIPNNERRNSNMSLCFIDINGLKNINDTLGHEKGDELIQTAVDVIKKEIREHDFILRLGGDEFLIVFDNTNEEEAEHVWQRITEAYDKINNTEERAYNISVSHGIVSQDMEGNHIVDSMIKTADEKMYTEKKEIKKTFNAIK